MMKPIRIGEGDDSTVYVCLHWRTFPVAFAGRPETAEELRDNKVIDGVAYQRYKTWEKECGLIRMAEPTCKTCTHFRRLEIVPHQVPKLFKTDGSGEWTPAVDMPSIAAQSRNRLSRQTPDAALRKTRSTHEAAAKASEE